MSLKLEDPMGRRLEFEPTTFGGENGAVVRASFGAESIVVQLDPNQTAILHAKLGEMLGANAEESAEEKFSARIDRLGMAIENLHKSVAKLAPQAALDALAEAFTAEMAKVKEAIGRPTEPSDLEAPAPDKPMVTRATRTTKNYLTFATYHNSWLCQRQETSLTIIKIGKDARSDIRVEEVAAADMHAVIEVGPYAPGDITLIDLGSEMGTKVNGVRANKRKLALGDQIQIGDSKIVLEHIG